MNIPIIEEGGVRYYPIRFILENVLLRANYVGQICGKYSDYIKKFKVNYGYYAGGTQEVNCISEIGLRLFLINGKVGQLDISQRQALNGLLEYLHMDTVNEDIQFIDKLDNKKLNNYPIFIIDIIEEVLKDNPSIIWQKCSKCNNYYPYSKVFFNQNQHSSKGLNTYCKECDGNHEGQDYTSFVHPDNDLNNIYKNYGEEYYIAFKNHDTIKIFQWYLNFNKKHIPLIIHNKEDYLKIIKYLYNNNLIDKENLVLKNIMKQYNITSLTHVLTSDDIYKLLYGDDYKSHPWKFPSIKLYDLTIEEAKIIFNNYLKINNIIIENVYNFNYKDIIFECGLKNYTKDDMLDFVMKYYDNKYGAYKFKLSGENYWKHKDNADRAMKYFIEEDIKIPVEKIPLYVTLNVLQQKARTLYYMIYKKKFYSSIYEWVNSIYPGKFIEADFHIGVIRNKFDSVEEEQIYNLLKDEFSNVIYNKRNTDNTVKFDGMIPDYLIFSTKECILGEYFGLYVPDRADSSKRIKDYVKKTDDKIERYKNINYKKLFIFPNDLKYNMDGIKEKIKILKL